MATGLLLKNTLLELFKCHRLSVRDIVFEILKLTPLTHTGTLTVWPRMSVLTIKAMVQTPVSGLSLGFASCTGAQVAGYALLDLVRPHVPPFVDGPFTGCVLSPKQLLIATEAADELLSAHWTSNISQVLSQHPAYHRCARFEGMDDALALTQACTETASIPFSRCFVGTYALDGGLTPLQTDSTIYFVQGLLKALDDSEIGHIYARLHSDAVLEILEWEVCADYQHAGTGLGMLAALCSNIESAVHDAVSRIVFNTRPVQFPYGDLSHLPSELILTAWDALETVQGYIEDNASVLITQRRAPIPVCFEDSFPLARQSALIPKKPQYLPLEQF